MTDKTKENIIDKLTKVCVCTGVSRASIKKSIQNGAKSFDDIKSKTGAGSGSCCGKRCREKIENLLKEEI